MRILAMVAALILAIGSSPALSQTRSPGTEGGTGLRRVMLLVEDIDRAVDFYSRLGLAKAADQTTAQGDGGRVFGVNELPLTADPTVGRLVAMRGGAERGSGIDLLSYDRPRLPSARGNLAALGTGDVVIVVEVADIGDSYRRLTQIGTRFHRTPYRFTEASGDGGSISGQRMFAFDPDGHLIQAVQFDRK